MCECEAALVSIGWEGTGAASAYSMMTAYTFSK